METYWLLLIMLYHVHLPIVAESLSLGKPSQRVFLVWRKMCFLIVKSITFPPFPFYFLFSFFSANAVSLSLVISVFTSVPLSSERWLFSCPEVSTWNLITRCHVSCYSGPYSHNLSLASFLYNFLIFGSFLFTYVYISLYFSDMYLLQLLLSLSYSQLKVSWKNNLCLESGKSSLLIHFPTCGYLFKLLRQRAYPRFPKLGLFCIFLLCFTLWVIS